jgi:pyruvate/2-oxoacid:ferredoxin oxidoreductase beta subunit/Pyruvate/2-oxoacid:ferredoxin oxidoreductase gamma subunit
MKSQLLTDNKMPFCPGCGHGVAVNHLSKALMEMGYDPFDIVIVSDIGCSGLVDPLFTTHTVHGLHGRSPALGMGVSMGLANENKKIIVVQGDGGATIGLQHLMEAARRNVDITLLVFNNLLYGMTGGQISGLSTDKFKELKHFEEGIPPFDIIRLAHQAGAASSARVISPKNFNESIKNAVQTKGFSVLELASVCPSYGIKKLKELEDFAEDAEVFTNDRILPKIEYKKTDSLFDNLKAIDHEFESDITDKMGFVLAGSAGGGVQSAAKLLAQAGIMSGLYTTMKGEYPVTVGTGFSVAEVILSRKPIHYTGLEHPDIIFVVSNDGLQKVKNRISLNTKVFVDNQMSLDAHHVIRGAYVKNGGKKGAALNALASWINQTHYLDKNALLKAINQHKHADKLLAAMPNSAVV